MNVFQLRTEAIPLVRIGIVGLGERGIQALKRLCQIEGAYVSALCDISDTQLKHAIQEMKNIHPSSFNHIFTHYQDICKADDVDLIYICTDWLTHTPIILEALQHGKHVAVEVPAATTLADIYSIIDAAEQSQRHCMMLENCVYDYFEMAINEMVHQGIFGEIVHVEGGYAHPLGEKWPSWRLEYNKEVRGDVYPTHGIGPACLLLDIHRNDHLQTLVCMDSSSFMGKDIYQKMTGKETSHFQNGDQTTTLLRTTKGKTILLQHNVMTPRPYSRMFQVVGTKGFAEKTDESKNIKGDILPPSSFLIHPSSLPHPASFLPSYIKPLTGIGKTLDSRGGMAYFMDWRLIHCLRHGLPLDMDVYDLAEWCAIAELSRQSIEQGFKPIDFPHFCG